MIKLVDYKKIKIIKMWKKTIKNKSNKVFVKKKKKHVQRMIHFLFDSHFNSTKIMCLRCNVTVINSSK